jgi:hypothetical protein
VTKSLADASARDEIVQRIGRLTPQTPARWGKMDCPKMLAHIGDALKMATGELHVPFKRTPLRLWPVRTLFIYWLPMPKGAPTAPVLVRRTADEWQREVDDVCGRLRAFPPQVDGEWPVHPVFGPMTARDWGVLGYKHLDHHLRQFGV